MRHPKSARTVAQACGSGATTAGIALANKLSGYDAAVLGYGVCDDEEYFHNFINDLFSGLGCSEKAQDLVRMRQSKGAGYAMSRCGCQAFRGCVFASSLVRAVPVKFVRCGMHGAA